MLKTEKYIRDKFKIDLNTKSPIMLPINRFGGLTGLWRELGYKVGAEIGVSRGKYSKWISIRTRPDILYLVDPYDAYSEYVEQHGESGQIKLNSHYEDAKKRLSKFRVKFIKKHSMDAVKDFEDNSLDFVFIDGNHTFEYAVNDIAEWSKKVRPGGLICGHDYWNSVEIPDKHIWANVKTATERMKLCQVKDVVDAWTKTNKIEPWFLTNDKTWFWIKNE